MSYTDLDTLIAELEFNASVEASEGLDNTKLTKFIVSATRLHNQSYTVSDTECTIPKKEENAVVLLSWINLLYWRATKLASAPSTSNSSGFGIDRDTPFQKTSQLIKDLKARYQEECNALGLDIFAGTGVAKVSEVTVESLDFNAQVPLELASVPQSITLTAATAAIQPDGTLVLRWEQAAFSNFYSYTVLYTQGATPLFQEWNCSPTAAVPPRILNTATIAGVVTSQNIHSVKLQDIPVTPGLTHRFLVVCRSRSETYSYSNEVTITQA